MVWFPFTTHSHQVCEKEKPKRNFVACCGRLQKFILFPAPTISDKVEVSANILYYLQRRLQR